MLARNLLNKPWPLWLKICTALVCTTVVVTLLAVQLDQKYRQAHISAELEQQSYLMLKLISAGAQESVIVEDIPLLDTLVRETAALDSDLISIIITNESGRELIRWDKSGNTVAPEVYKFGQEIEYEGELFGYVYAQWDPVSLSEKVDVRLSRGRRTLVLALLCLTSFSLFLLHVLVASPLNQLSDSLRTISTGHTSQKVSLRSSKEMSMLADAINDLGTSMEDSRSLTNELEYQANHDLLTGLKNRHYFEKMVRQRLARRTGESVDDLVIYFDLDQFKVVNDTSGHAAGDALLMQLATTLSAQLRSDDTFARLGGDEFAVFLPSTDFKEGMIIADAIRTAAQDFRFSFEDRSFVVGASIGVVTISDKEENFERIMSAADQACYAAKDAGRNRVHVYHEDDEELTQRHGEMSWVPKIHEAIENSKLVLFGQVIEPTKAQRSDSTHVEVLVRMLGNNGEMIPPGAFLPAAERYGIMPTLDRWIIEHTLEWMEEQAEVSGHNFICAINISATSMSDEKFRNFLFDLLAQTGAPCSQICFEMTETAAVANISIAADFMNRVKDSGCSFALDDFGSGMSSFNYLKNLPVDYVKIDGAFVSPIMNDKTSVVMVRAIADVARVMGIKTIAEFVETEEIRNKISELDIDYVQGYGVGIPQLLTNFNNKNSFQTKAA